MLHFFGSINIVKYLVGNNVELTPSIWIYAVHSNNIELLHYIEKNFVGVQKDENDKNKNDDDNNNSDENIFNPKENYEDCLLEAIKCHHIKVANYYHLNFLNSVDEINAEIFTQGVKHYDLVFIENDFFDKLFLDDLCKYDYFIIVEELLKRKDIDINFRKIVIQLFNYVLIEIKFNKIPNINFFYYILKSLFLLISF